MPAEPDASNPPPPEEVRPAARIAGSAYAGEPHDLANPADAGHLATVGWADPDLADLAVRSAGAASADWADTTPHERAAALRAIADTLREHSDELAALISAESGKRIAEATAEVGFSAQYLDWFAIAGTHPRDEHRLTDARRFVVRRVPVGVVAAVSPWNFPLSIPVRKVAAALAAGCPVVQKASELTPLTSLAFTELAERHLPDGVLSVLVGDGEKLTTVLVDHPDVAAMTFTGSTRVGSLVAARAMRSMTRVTLELGGRAPFVVCDDADVAQAVDALMVAKFRNNGASCIAANNVFVHDDVYDAFVADVRDRIGAMRIGDPSDPATDLGPMIREDHVLRLAGLVHEAVAAGSTAVRGATCPEEGWYATPVLVEATADTGLWNDEIFGPVCAVRRYQDEDAVVSEVERWRTGLGGYVMSADPEHALSLASRLRVGIVGINNGAPNTPEVPFGGFGAAGIGREGGLSGLLEFTEEQTLSMAR